MLCPIENREYLEELDELISLQNQVKALRLQDGLGKQIFHEDMKKVFEPVTDILKDTPRDITKSITETSVANKALENLSNKLLELMKNRGIIASYLMSPLSKITNPEHTSEFELVKDPNSNRVNDLLLNKTIPVTLYNNLLIFRDTGEKFELQGSLLKMITIKNYNADLANIPDEKLMFEFAKEMYSDEEALRNKSTRDKFISLLKSPAINASGISTIFLEENPNELCDRLKLILQEGKAGNTSSLIKEEVVAMADKIRI